MNSEVEHKRLLIMKTLRESEFPLSSGKIHEQLLSKGIEISERTVRFHLQVLDSHGLTEYKEKKGRFLTTRGREELTKAHVYHQVGYLSAKIDEMTCKMNFDPSSAQGTVLINFSTIDKHYRDVISDSVSPVFSSGLAHGTLMCLFDEGERIGDCFVTQGKIGIGTVCAITLNGALIKAGIPIRSIFGGLLEIINGAPSRFTAIIHYDGTSLDPLEIYISSGMTSILSACINGEGQIGASFREIPIAAREKTIEIDSLLKSRGLGGFLKLGYPSQSLLGIPVGDKRVGLVIAGGLNATAPLGEKGIPIESSALSGLIDYSKLFHYEELTKRLSQLKK
ncbi:hypothetical protein S1OALGB6SA_257 [Olavius algarvensis spirochete endosymbiont]|uniref:DUF128 domain-containing protein n=1 Tax=Olavius algarvensis spirochete endosymbiont TaxID=260710 RepID=UPI000F173825|nr:NrpR regulatory domain-containing protein [Olavius algarvensis spirochete endosymbiont]VDA99194.1 hypothetical protein S1OALGB6SA_257 [Olavius algarvensis spirochete endosymbiont]